MLPGAANGLQTRFQVKESNCRSAGVPARRAVYDTPTMDRRHFLTALPALALAPRLAAQSAPASLKVRGLSQLTLTVSDVSRSLKFYQDLFGMPIQARQGTTLFLRIGSGPQFLALKQAAAGERPSISAFGMGVEDFSIDRVLRVLEQNGVTRATGDAAAPQPMTVRVVPRPGHTAASGPPPSDVYVADPSGLLFRLHDVPLLRRWRRQRHRLPHGRGIAAERLARGRDMSHFTVGVADQPKTVGVAIRRSWARTSRPIKARHRRTASAGRPLPDVHRRRARSRRCPPAPPASITPACR